MAYCRSKITFGLILSKRPKIVFQGQSWLIAGHKLHSAFIKLPFVIKIFVLSIFEWSFYTGFTVKFMSNGACHEKI